MEATRAFRYRGDCPCNVLEFVRSSGPRPTLETAMVQRGSSILWHRGQTGGPGDFGFLRVDFLGRPAHFKC